MGPTGNGIVNTEQVPIKNDSTCTQELPTQQLNAKVVIMGALGTREIMPSRDVVPERAWCSQ